MNFSRADRSRAAEWWFTIDRRMVTVILILMAIGIVLALAASPAVAVRKGLPAFYFAERQLLYAMLGCLVMVTASLLSPREIRRLALALLLASFAAMIWVAVSGPEINGARRWVRIA